jgi:hypothetical protein
MTFTVTVVSSTKWRGEKGFWSSLGTIGRSIKKNKNASKKIKMHQKKYKCIKKNK